MTDTEHGFTLIEAMLVVAVVGIVAALAAPATIKWSAGQNLSASSVSVSYALSHARSEAIRTANIHLVFFQLDTGGNPLVAPNGSTVPILVVDDGRPGAAGQNCTINAGEAVLGLGLEDGVTFGASAATAKVPSDEGGGTYTSGTTFTDTGGNPATWVMFRPEGRPLRFSGACATGAIGSGGGAVYLTNGDRDEAVVLLPLGNTRPHTWNDASWSL